MSTSHALRVREQALGERPRDVRLESSPSQLLSSTLGVCQVWKLPLLLEMRDSATLVLGFTDTKPRASPPANSIDPDKQLYQGQAGFQVFLLLCAFVSVPVMLLVKPYLNKKQREKESLTRILQQQQSDRGAFSEVKEDEEANIFDGSASSSAIHSVDLAAPENPAEAGHAGAHGDHEEHSFADEMIHSGIHTIEFVLGAVSNTASYLRLWALSLAHAQLSSVFWNKMIMQYGALTGNAFMMFLSFAVWAGATFAVLLCMDVLECFLHALRLHWVEFQNKFYYADGIAFEPFSLTPEVKKD